MCNTNELSMADETGDPAVKQATVDYLRLKAGSRCMIWSGCPNHAEPAEEEGCREEHLRSGNAAR